MASDSDASEGVGNVESVTVLTGAKGSAEVKFTWTICDWAEKVKQKLGADAGSHLHLDVYSRWIDNEDSGILGDGRWSLSVTRKSTVELLPAGAISVYVEYDSCDLDGQVQLRALLRTCSPTIELNQVIGELLDSSTNRFALEKDIMSVPSRFWTAHTLVVEVTAVFAERKFLRLRAGEYSSVDSKLCSVMRQFYSLGSFTDAVLVSSDKQEIKCHRIVLIASSDVFRAMFDHDTTEKTTGVCKITDIKHVALKALVDMFYGIDVVDQLAEMAEDVYKAADKYQVQFVKNRCLVLLKETVTVGNAVVRFVFAKTHELDGLKEEVGRCVNEHHEEFIASNGMDKVIRLNKKHRDEFMLLTYSQQSKKRSAAEAEV